MAEYAEQMTQAGSTLSEQLAQHTLATEPDARMLSGRIEGRLLQLLVTLNQAVRVLEIGTFTGYSALVLAEALPAHGQVHSVDHDAAMQAKARAWLEQSAHGSKIQLHCGDGLALVRQLPGLFDLIFLDADKERYPEYLPECIARLSARGILVIDNCWWSGRVLQPTAPSDQAISQLNDELFNRRDLLQLMLPVRDGIQLVMKRQQPD